MSLLVWLVLRVRCALGVHSWHTFGVDGERRAIYQFCVRCPRKRQRHSHADTWRVH